MVTQSINRKKSSWQLKEFEILFYDRSRQSRHLLQVSFTLVSVCFTGKSRWGCWINSGRTRTAHRGASRFQVAIAKCFCWWVLLYEDCVLIVWIWAASPVPSLTMFESSVYVTRVGGKKKKKRRKKRGKVKRIVNVPGPYLRRLHLADNLIDFDAGAVEIAASQLDGGIDAGRGGRALSGPSAHYALALGALSDGGALSGANSGRGADEARIETALLATVTCVSMIKRCAFN